MTHITPTQLVQILEEGARRGLRMIPLKDLAALYGTDPYDLRDAMRDAKGRGHITGRSGEGLTVKTGFLRRQRDTGSIAAAREEDQWAAVVKSVCSHVHRPTRQVRKCMCCPKEFVSEGIHNRLCGRCRNIDAGFDAVGYHIVTPRGADT